MKIVIETINHKDQRYPTVGDWFYKKDKSGEKVLHIKVSWLPRWEMVALIAVHELVEVLLCKSAGVSQAEVDRFDKEFERARDRGQLAHPDDEPGDNPGAPYKRQHCFATAVERMLCAEMGISWSDYADEVEKLP